ncbi:MAG: 3-hydroxyacyl-CoA dehydrogenase family protein [Thermodesulfobacteriota bacterium]|nr:3-hydroxyacyl-CoA dehydrogenase family protein [Thermodesulfobacteriota bacterium]
MKIGNILIIGAGLMGSGIAQVCAQAGIQVFMNDVSQEILNHALKGIRWSVGKLIEKGKLKEDLEKIMARISPVTDFNQTSQVDLAIEAVFEKLELKQEIFKKLDQFGRPETLFASNTSAIPTTEIAAVTQRPERVLGLHFFNPVPMMEVVEVVKGMKTSEETMRAGVEFVRSIGKEPIRVESDVPGFLLNRINLVGYIEAIRLLEQGIGTVEDIDKGVRLAFGRRMGPFETGDLVGLDVSYGALTAIYEESKDARYYPPQLLRRKAKAGELGRKTGRGWYEYNRNGSKKEK